MDALELRNKWIESIANVDDRFLRMVDALYESYKSDENEVDFYDELPREIQDLLIESQEHAKAGRVTSHAEVMAKYRKKYGFDVAG